LTVTHLVVEACSGITERGGIFIPYPCALLSTINVGSFTSGKCTFVLIIIFTVIISSSHTCTFIVTLLVAEAWNGITVRVGLRVLICTKAGINLACADLTCKLFTDLFLVVACSLTTETWTTFILIPIVPTINFLFVIRILAVTGIRTCATTWRPLFGYTGIFAATLAIRANLVREAAWKAATGRAIFYVMGLTITSDAVTLVHGTWVFILYTLGRRNAGAAGVISITTST